MKIKLKEITIGEVVNGYIKNDDEEGVVGYGGKLVAHHIKNFSSCPELRTSIENGITLSEKAHKEFHKKYGIKNNTKEQLEKFLISSYLY